MVNKVKRRVRQGVKLGAPRKHDSQKILSNHLTQDQWKRMQEEAAIRGQPAWEFIRYCLDMAITALDSKRGAVEASAMFDDLLAEPSKT